VRPPVRITWCVCRQTPFEHLLRLAREHDWDVEAVTAQTGCGDQCGLCRPYLRRMLATGETVFHEILSE
jgi:bacterioferritin-associated ferredoxin